RRSTEQGRLKPVIIPLRPQGPCDLGSFGPFQVLVSGAEANRATVLPSHGGAGCQTILSRMLVSGLIGKPSPRSTASPHNEGPLMVIVTWAGPTAPSRQPDPPGSQSWGQAPRHRSEKRIRFGSLVGDLLG